MKHFNIENITLKKGTLTLIAARPNSGKTSLGLHFVHKALEVHHGVVIWQLSMETKEVQHRLHAIQIATPLAEKQTLYFIEDCTLNIDQVSEKLRGLKSKSPKITLFMVDYFQLIKGSGSMDRAYEQNKISIALKALAKELDIAILLLTQLPPRVKNRPILSDIYNQASIENSDLVLLLYHDSMKDTREIILAKTI